MKLLVGLLLTLLPLAVAQDQQKHLMVATVNGDRPVQLSASSIERGPGYPSLVELKGNVEIRTQVCIQRAITGRDRGQLVCAGGMILHADEAVFHEDTGEVEARGSVKVTPIYYQRKK